MLGLGDVLSDRMPSIRGVPQISWQIRLEPERQRNSRNHRPYQAMHH